MRTVAPGRAENSELFADRFFERQREEIMSRLDTERYRRNLRWRVLPLLAASLLAAVLVFSVVGSTPERPPELYATWLSELAVDQPMPCGEPLAAFGAWGLSETDASFVSIPTGGEEEVATLLPPLYDTESSSPGLGELLPPEDDFELWFGDFHRAAPHVDNNRQQG